LEPTEGRTHDVLEFDQDDNHVERTPAMRKKTHTGTVYKHDREMNGSETHNESEHEGETVDGNQEVEEIEDSNHDDAVTPAELGQEPIGNEVGDYVQPEMVEDDTADEDNSDGDEALNELINRKVEAVNVDGNEQPAGVHQETKHSSTKTRVAANGCVVPTVGNLIIPTKRAGSQEAAVLESNDEQ